MSMEHGVYGLRKVPCFVAKPQTITSWSCQHETLSGQKRVSSMVTPELVGEAIVREGASGRAGPVDAPAYVSPLFPDEISLASSDAHASP